jgi:hypothetical protein
MTDEKEITRIAEEFLKRVSARMKGSQVLGPMGQENVEDLVSTIKQALAGSEITPIGDKSDLSPIGDKPTPPSEAKVTEAPRPSLPSDEAVTLIINELLDDGKEFSAGETYGRMVYLWNSIKKSVKDGNQALDWAEFQRQFYNRTPWEIFQWVRACHLGILEQHRGST